jgi:hypothetical protein
MHKEEIIQYLTILNKKLKEKDINAEINIYGGAVMCLYFNSRTSTQDIDAIFYPSHEIRKLISEIATDYNLPDNWLNDGVKGYLSNNNDVIDLEQNLSNIKLCVASPEYMLAMKAMSARINIDKDSKDVMDLKFLLSYLEITTVSDAIDVVLKYFPSSLILPKTEYLLEEILLENNVKVRKK